jgi:hypothetical protein
MYTLPCLCLRSACFMLAMVECQHVPLHALGPLDAACTMHRPGPSGLGLVRLGLFESAWLGLQAFYSATAFDANIGAWNTASVSNMSHVCPHRRCLGLQSACFMLAFVHFSSITCALLTARRFSPVRPRPTAAVAPHLDCRAPAHRSVRFRPLDASCTMHRTGRRGSGLMRQGLFEGVWLGSQVFYFASTFNQNLSAWNVVRVTVLANMFGSAALSACNQNKLYVVWGTTLRAAYPAWASSLCVSSIAPVNIQVSSAATVTIRGAGFSNLDPSPSAYLSGQPCRTTTWTSATQFVCAAPSPVLATGARRASHASRSRVSHCWKLQVHRERCG